MFGDRDSGRYLAKFSWTPSVRHHLVTGGAAPAGTAPPRTTRTSPRSRARCPGRRTGRSGSAGSPAASSRPAGTRRNLPSKADRQVNCGRVIATNIAADLASWARLLGFHDQEGLRDAEPDTLRYRIWHIPGRLVRHARKKILKISPD